MRLVFFGTPALAVPTLERLLAGRHRIASVVSQPDRPRGRGRSRAPSPVAQRALEADLPLLRPERAAEPALREALLRAQPDLGVVVAFGQFLPKRIRELPRLGYLINAHASLLPKYRGAAPIARAILGGETRTGISVMRVEREMDAGPVALVRELPIGPDETCGELEERLGGLAADAIEAALEQIADGSVAWREQDPTRATFAPKLEREEAQIDWREPAERLARLVRALSPKPGATTSLDGEPLRILLARALPGPGRDAPGTVRSGGDGTLRVATGDGWLVPLRLQRAGGRALEVEAFLRGRPVPDGSRLGAPPTIGSLGSSTPRP